MGKKLTGRPKLMIFDMDGLIFDTENLFFTLECVRIKEYGYEMTKEKYMRTLGANGVLLRSIMAEMFGEDYPMAEISRVTREDLNEYARTKGLPVKDGIPELLAWLKEEGIPCCVASSTHSPYVHDYLDKSGLLPYFSFITGGEQVSRSKPNPDIFLVSCEHFGIAPCDSLVLEDSENGLLAAHNGGIPSICIPDMKYPGSEFADYPAAIVKNAFEVLDLLKAL